MPGGRLAKTQTTCHLAGTIVRHQASGILIVRVPRTDYEI